jgi:NitT/TauT family transport system substrate-binding protein
MNPMHQRYRAVLACVLLLLAIPFAGLSAEGTTEVSEQPLRFGSLPAISALPVIYAEESGYFDDEELAVEIVPFNSPTDRNVALQAGRIDAFVGDVMTAITFREAGFPVVVTSDIVEDFKLLGAPRSGIESVADLDGRSVSLVPGFVLEYIMDEIAAAAGVTYEVVIIPSISARFEALLSGQIDAVLFTEPQASLLAAAGARVLAGSNEEGIRAGAMIFRSAFADANPAAIRAWYRAYDRAAAALDGTDLADHADLLAAYGFPPDVAAAVSGPVRMSGAAPIPVSTISSVAGWMAEKGTVEEIDLEGLTDWSFLPAE